MQLRPGSLPAAGTLDRPFGVRRSLVGSSKMEAFRPSHALWNAPAAESDPGRAATRARLLLKPPRG